MHRFAVQWLAGLQWLTFMFTNTVVIPLSVGGAFHQTPAEIAGTMSRSFIVTGLACLLQVFVGHRLPLMEGQSGLWWGVVLGLANIGVSTGQPLSQVGGSLAVGMAAGGLALVLSGVFGLHRLLNRLFTPVVMAVLLFLLAAQLIDIFFQGMVGYEAGGKIHPKLAVLSFAVVLVVGALTVGARGLLSNFSILIGICVGWLAYIAVFGQRAALVVPHWDKIASVFPWGQPAWNAGIIVASVVTAMLNTTNTIATLRAAEPVFGQKIDDAQYRRSLVLSGFYTAASGPLGLIPYAPYTSSIGFLRTTRLYDRLPFIIGAILFTFMGAVPALVGFFTTLPISIGNAVLFIAYLQLFGAALTNLDGLELNFRSAVRIGLPTLLGLAIQSMPAAAFTAIPGPAQSLLSNGMLVGILVSILLEGLVPWRSLDAQIRA